MHAGAAGPGGARRPRVRLACLPWLVLLAAGCDGTRPDAEAGSAPVGVFADGDVPGNAANADANANQGRPARYAPVWVHGRGPFADGLPGRIFPGLADGWQGVLHVADDCAQDDCLHWSLVSVDGRNRVERLPAIAIADAVNGEAAEVLDARVRAHLESVRAQHFPDSSVVSVVAEEPRAYGVGHQVMMTIAYPHAGHEMTAGIRAWLQAVDERNPWDTATSGATTLLWTRIFSAPQEAFDVYALSQVADSARLSREGADAWLADCLGNAHAIRVQQYIGAGGDAMAAESRCRQQDALRRSWEASGQTADGNAASAW